MLCILHILLHNHMWMSGRLIGARLHSNPRCIYIPWMSVFSGLLDCACTPGKPVLRMGWVPSTLRAPIGFVNTKGFRIYQNWNLACTMVDQSAPGVWRDFIATLGHCSYTRYKTKHTAGVMHVWHTPVPGCVASGALTLCQLWCITSDIAV